MSLKKTCKKKSKLANEVKKRFESFDEDINHWSDYDYIIINENLDVCFRQIEHIILKNKKILTFC